MNEPIHIKGVAACRIIGCSPRRLRDLVGLGLIGTRELPGGIGTRRYKRADCERIAREAIREARQTEMEMARV